MRGTSGSWPTEFGRRRFLDLASQAPKFPHGAELRGFGLWHARAKPCRSYKDRFKLRVESRLSSANAPVHGQRLHPPITPVGMIWVFFWRVACRPRVCNGVSHTPELLRPHNARFKARNMRTSKNRPLRRSSVAVLSTCGGSKTGSGAGPGHPLALLKSEPAPHRAKRSPQAQALSPRALTGGTGHKLQRCRLREVPKQSEG